MIVNSRQYEDLRHEAFRQACPGLWSLLNTPFGAMTPPRKIGEHLQRKALAELRAIAHFPVPSRLYLDDPPEPRP